MSGKDVYMALKDIVELHLLDYLPETDPQSDTLRKAMSYSLTAGGKRLRPVLILAGLRFCGQPVEFGLPFAVAAEYIQTYSLIHDDLPAMDNDDLRRGKPTNHKVFGEDIAILAGDGLLSAAYEVMSKDMLHYLDDPGQLKKKVKACFELSRGTGCRGMVAGQVADVEQEGSICSPEMLDYIHNNKTAAFLRSCVNAGAYLGGADKEKLDILRIYGENMGLAFQIADDIMDVRGDTAVMGKPAGSDERSGKNTYPLIHGMDASVKRAEELINSAESALELYFNDADLYLYVLDLIREQIRA